jgi:hypothetical protein
LYFQRIQTRINWSLLAKHTGSVLSHEIIHQDNIQSKNKFKDELRFRPHWQNWKIGRSLIYFEMIITHHSQSRNHQKKMSKLCQEGKVADEINVNAMTDERKTIWSDNKRVAVWQGQHIYPGWSGTKNAQNWQLSLSRYRTTG